MNKPSANTLGFNPCFDGSVARGRSSQPLGAGVLASFNPCFDGSVARGARQSR